MRVIILGSAAGGGVPQWNCGCRNCTEARHSNRSRTQSSVAVSADGERWILLNASPDLRTQLAAHRSLWPPSGSRATPVRAVVLTDGEIDHTLGLLLLRESADRLPVYAPAGVTALLGDEWPLYRVLSAYSGVEPRALEEGRPIALTDRAGRPLGICCSATAVARRPPRYARAAPTQAFDVGLRLTDEPISCSLTARSGRTTSSVRPEQEPTRRRRARWATSRSAARVAAWSSCRNSTRNASCSFMSTTPIRSCVAAQRSGR